MRSKTKKQKITSFDKKIVNAVASDKENYFFNAVAYDKSYNFNAVASFDI
jgi:hypothetical protein